MKKIPTIFFLAIFLLLPAAFSFASASLPKNVNVDGIAPDFRLPDLNGKAVSLSEFRGRPVVLFIWTTWCPFCRMELLDLQQRYNDIKTRGVEVLAIDTGEAKDKVEKFIDKKGIAFPILLDSASEVAVSYNVIGVPTIVLIDLLGKIVFQGNELPEDFLQILAPK